MNPIGDLMATLSESLGFVVTGTVTAFFLFFILLLWLWRGVALTDDEEEKDG